MTATSPTPRRPKLAIVVVVYNMQREAPRTLYALSADCQQGVNSQDYEVIVIENGSSAPLSPAEVSRFGDNFHYHRIDDASPSPAGAINFGATQSDAANIGVMIDGARIASPGVVALALQALENFDRPVVSTIGFHLGPAAQPISVTQGYDQQVEDQLLASVDWRQNAYRLFEISALAYSSSKGWLGPIAESNLSFLPRALFDELEGFDERFDLPGGGLVNPDFHNRANKLSEITPITLFGEATFHQVHGGIMTNRPHNKMRRPLKAYHKQYKSIRGVRFRQNEIAGMLLGFPKPEVLTTLKNNCESMLKSTDELPVKRLIDMTIKKQVRRFKG